MKKLNTNQQKEALTNFLKKVTKNENLFIKTDEIKGNRFAIAEKQENNSISTKSNFMSYQEMNCYFFGVLASLEKRINF
jgi:hypothetical protein